MGLTLVAILTAALLLPGIIAAHSFYGAAKTKEVAPSPPLLSSAGGVALVGFLSVLVHLVYVLVLRLLARADPIIGLPLANPYLMFLPQIQTLPPIEAAASLFLGLAWLCVTAWLIGLAVGRIFQRIGDPGIFYGPLTDIVKLGQGDNRFIVAYVLTSIGKDSRLIGYRGTVVSMGRDPDRFPTKLLLKDVAIFYLDFDGETPVRREQAGTIDWLTLSSDNWHNVALQVFEVALDLEDDAPTERPSQ